jgi:hypothetical protein
LGRLNQLRRLDIVKFRKRAGRAPCSSIEKLINLRPLSVSAIRMGEVIDTHYLSSSPQFLQRIYLTGSLQCPISWYLQSCVYSYVKERVLFWPDFDTINKKDKGDQNSLEWPEDKIKWRDLDTKSAPTTWTLNEVSDGETCLIINRKDGFVLEKFILSLCVLNMKITL